MSKFLIRHEINSSRSILHVVNFLIACEIASIESSRPMVRAFHLGGEDVAVEIPDALDSRFMDALVAVKIRFEKISASTS